MFQAAPPCRELPHGLLPTTYRQEPEWRMPDVLSSPGCKFYDSPLHIAQCPKWASLRFELLTTCILSAQKEGVVKPHDRTQPLLPLVRRLLSGTHADFLGFLLADDHVTLSNIAGVTPHQRITAPDFALLQPAIFDFLGAVYLRRQLQQRTEDAQQSAVHFLSLGGPAPTRLLRCT